MGWHEWRPYVPVAVKRARSLGKMESLRRKGLDVQRVAVDGRGIARTFWGRAWCDHLEKFSDFANRLPRGRSYVRNGLVCHLEITEGAVKAIVSGSELYHVDIHIRKLPEEKWSDVRCRCAGQIGSLLELLQGRLSEGVMSIVTDREKGIFPLPSEVSLKCSCPDWAVMCKHVAAVLYGVGARLDQNPELLFCLRGVDHEELIRAEVGFAVGSAEAGGSGRRHIAEAELSDVFGIEIVGQRSPKNVLDDGCLMKGKRAPGGAAGPKRKPSAPGSRKKSSKATPARQVQKAAQSSAKAQSTTAEPPCDSGRAKRRPDPGSENVTGPAVAKLRAKFKLSRSQFAQLIGVSSPTIVNWEGREGRLHLQGRTRKSWNLVSKFSRREALEKLAAIAGPSGAGR